MPSFSIPRNTASSITSTRSCKRTPVHPAVIALGDVQRNHAVHRRPQRLRNQVGIADLVAKTTLLYSLFNRHHQQGISVDFRVSLDPLIFLVELAAGCGVMNISL